MRNAWPILAFLSAVVLAEPTLAGEPGPAAPAAPKPRQVEKLNEQLLAMLRTEAGPCSTVLVGKVLKAGEVAEDKERPELPGENPMWGMGGGAGQFGPRAQAVRIQVKEVIRGPKTAAELGVTVRHFDFGNAQRRLYEANPKGTFKPEDVVREGGLKAGEEYLFLLAVDQNLAPAEGDGAPGCTTIRLPLFGPPPEAAEALRRLVAAIGAWQSPPELSAEQRKAVEGHVLALASREFAARQKAHQGLLAIGPAAAKLIGESRAKSADLEVRLRCERLLEEMKPIPGAQPENWAGDLVIRKIEKKPEEAPVDPAGGK